MIASIISYLQYRSAKDVAGNFLFHWHCVAIKCLMTIMDQLLTHDVISKGANSYKSLK